MAGKKRWVYERINNGHNQIKLRSWKLFLDYVYQELLEYGTYVWRGQRKSNWQLYSTLDRSLQLKLNKNILVRNDGKILLNEFKYATLGRRGFNPRILDSDNDWWALGQHHGLSTPLLDWTSSPFVAAYFAFIEKGEKQTKYRAVFAMHRPSIEKKAGEILKANKDNLQQKIKTKSYPTRGNLKPEIEFIRPFSDENQRLINQAGLFTRAPFNVSLESWIKNNFGSDDENVLIKILIPNENRIECLKTLNRMNINHLTLFPDLDGASKYCNLCKEIDNY